MLDDIAMKYFTTKPEGIHKNLFRAGIVNRLVDYRWNCYLLCLKVITNLNNYFKKGVKTVDKIKLKRGRQEVTFKKLPSYFAVRLKQGKAASERALEACCGRPKAEIEHVDSAATENMEIFTVKEAAKLEETMDELRKAPTSDVITHMYARRSSNSHGRHDYPV